MNNESAYDKQELFYNIMTRKNMFALEFDGFFKEKRSQCENIYVKINHDFDNNYFDEAYVVVYDKKIDLHPDAIDKIIKYLKKKRNIIYLLAKHQCGEMLDGATCKLNMKFKSIYFDINVDNIKSIVGCLLYKIINDKIIKIVLDDVKV